MAARKKTNNDKWKILTRISDISRCIYFLASTVRSLFVTNYNSLSAAEAQDGISGRREVQGMGAADTCLTVIGFVTDRAKCCGCNTEQCSGAAVKTWTCGSLVLGQMFIFLFRPWFYLFYCIWCSVDVNYILTQKKKMQPCGDIHPHSRWRHLNCAPAIFFFS